MIEYPYTRLQVPRIVEFTVPNNVCLDDLIEMVGCSYGDLFVSTRQKTAAWKLWKSFNKEQYGVSIGEYAQGKNSEEDYLDSLIYFLYNAPVKADFFRFCAKAEGYSNPVEYVLMLLGD